MCFVLIVNQAHKSCVCIELIITKIVAVDKFYISLQMTSLVFKFNYYSSYYRQIKFELSQHIHFEYLLFPQVKSPIVIVLLFR